MNDRYTSSSVEPPLVTVALSVLNGGPTLELSVRSVLNQTWKNWMLLILDDGSTDGAIDHLPFLSDPRIVIVRDGENRGLSARLNQAVNMAQGKYFARMDHDDICHPERFARQVAFLEAHPKIDLLATECVTMDEEDTLNGILPSVTEHKAICRRPWLGFYMPHPAWMGRIEWFQCNRYPEPAPYCCEDQQLLLQAHRSSCYHVLPERLLAYRVRTYTPWRKLWRTRIAMLKIQFEYFASKGAWCGILLSALVTLVRIGNDGLRVLGFLVFGIQRRPASGVSLEELGRWSSLIQSLKAARGTHGDSMYSVTKV